MSEEEEKISGNHEERKRVRTEGWLLMAAALVLRMARSLAAAAARTFMSEPAVSPSASPEEAAKKLEEAEKKQTRIGTWVLIGGVIAWKAGKALAKILTPWLLSRRLPPSPSHPASDRRVEAREQVPEKPPQPLSPAAETLLGASVMGIAGARVAASALAGFVGEKLAALAPEEKQDTADKGREADRNLDEEKGLNLDRRERWGTFFVLLSFSCAFAGGIGFLVIYWTGGSNLLLGGNLAIFLGGLAATLVLWAHWLTIHKEAVEPREPLSSSLQERNAVSRVYREGEHDLRRRRLLLWMAGGAAAFCASFVVSLLKSLGFPPSTALDTCVWKRGQRLMTPDNQPVSVDTLRPGDMVLVFPEDSIGSEKSQTVLIRVHQDLLQLPPRRAGWAPMGYVAYSRVCTHAGCSVGMYEKTTHLLMCPCHQSTFDVLRGAEPTGGPAARPLPQLPLYADSEGVLHAADGFTNPPGPGYWGMP